MYYWIYTDRKIREIISYTSISSNVGHIYHSNNTWKINHVSIVEHNQ